MLAKCDIVLGCHSVMTFVDTRSESKDNDGASADIPDASTSSEADRMLRLRKTAVEAYVHSLLEFTFGCSITVTSIKNIPTTTNQGNMKEYRQRPVGQ